MHEIAVYGLSGDPITNGHRWVLEQTHQIYKKIFLVMATNHTKNYAFLPLERITMCRTLADEFPNVEFAVLTDEFLVKKAKTLGATVLLRGVRNNMDKEYEEGIELFNNWLAPELVTVYVQPPGELDDPPLLSPMEPPLSPHHPLIVRFVSSSLVRGIVGLKGWQEVAEKLVPSYVMPYLESFSRRSKE